MNGQRGISSPVLLNSYDERPGTRRLFVIDTKNCASQRASPPTGGGPAGSPGRIERHDSFYMILGEGQILNNLSLPNMY